MFKLLILTLLALNTYAYNLELRNGAIEAHTEVFGDNKINPATDEITSKLVMSSNIESITGTISIASISLKSEKKDRDENMYELLNIKVHSNISYSIKQIIKTEKNYEIIGELTLNGIKKDITSKAKISTKYDQIIINGDFSINLTDFNMEPPTMFFLTVRDQIDIKYNLTYKKEK